MDSGIGHSVAMLLGSGVAALVILIWTKIGNPSPPPPGGVDNGGPDDGDQAKSGKGSGTPRGDVDHGRKPREGVYVPAGPPDIIHIP